MGKLIQRRKRQFRKVRVLLPHYRRPLRAKSIIPKRLITLQKGGKVTLYKKRAPFKRIFKKRFHDPISYIQPFIDIAKAFKKRKKRTWSRKIKKSWTPKKASSIKRRKVSPFKTSRETWSMERKNFQRIWKTPQYKEFIKDLKIKHSKRFKVNQKKFQANLKRSFHHPLKGTNKYGKYPKEITNQLLFSIKPTRKMIKGITNVAAKGTLNKDIIKHIIKSELDNLRKKLLIYAKKVIGRYVPIDEGDLQKSMIDSIEHSKRIGYGLKMEMSAKVPHAGVANRMPQKMLQHPHPPARKDKRGRYDPHAQTHSFSICKMLIKEQARQLVKNMVNRLALELATRILTTSYVSGTRLRPAPRPLLRTKRKWRRVKPKFGKQPQWQLVTIPDEYRWQEYDPKTNKYKYVKLSPREESRFREARLRHIQGGYSIAVQTAHEEPYNKRLIRQWFTIRGLKKTRHGK